MTTIRRPGAASAAVLIGLSVSLITAHAIAPEWSRRAGLDVWNFGALEQDCRNTAEYAEEIASREECDARRREAANQIAVRLVADDAPLPVAADQIAEMFAGSAGIDTALRCSYPDVPTRRLRFARHAIERALRFVDDPERRAAVETRLEAAYRAMSAVPESPAAR